MSAELTPETLSALSDDDLGLLAAPLVDPGPWKHRWEYGNVVRDTDGVGTGTLYFCKKCEQEITVRSGKSFGERIADLTCTVPPRIDVTDWEVAMALFRATDGAERQLYKLYQRWDVRNVGSQKVITFANWLCQIAQPRHYIVAAILVAESEGE